MIFASLMGGAATPGQRAAAEARFVDTLCAELGGPAGAREAYETWLRLRAATAALTVPELTAKIRWESAFDSATWRALDEAVPEPGSAFFVVHLRDSPRRQPPGRP